METLGIHRIKLGPQAEKYLGVHGIPLVGIQINNLYT